MMVVQKLKLIGEFILKIQKTFNKRFNCGGFKFSRTQKEEFASILSSNNNDIKY